MNTLEIKIVEQLNNKRYRQHGDKLFDIANTEINSNQILLHEFIHVAAEIDDNIPIEPSKVFNARCNEFLRSIGKLSCIENSKVIDGSVSLRDELKVYALKKIIN